MKYGIGDPKEHKRSQGSQSGIVSLGSFLLQSQTVLWKGLFGGTCIHDGHSKALSQTGGNKGKSAKLTARGEEVVRKAECSVTCGRPRETQKMGGWVLPQS